MPSSKHTEPHLNSYPLGQACAQYLISLPSEDRAKAQPEITKFVHWYGETRLINELTAQEIENYAGHLSLSISELEIKISPVKDFLSYAYKNKLIKSRLAHLLKTRKTKLKSNLAGKSQDDNDIILTSEGFSILESELKKLINERPQIADEIRRAAADKDFRENAPLEAAKDHQGKVEGRIRELDTILKKAKFLEKREQTRGAFIGDKVKLRDLSTNETLIYVLVDVKEANPSMGKVSVNSPIGKAIISHNVGDCIEVIAPVGKFPYMIEEIISD